MDDETLREIEVRTGAPVTVIVDDAGDPPWSSWTERQVSSGRLSPGARGMHPADAADQYNAANALIPADDDFLYSPCQAQERVRAVLALVGIDIDEAAIIMLSDVDDTGASSGLLMLNCGQVEAAVEEHRLTTGEDLSAEALMNALPWSGAD